VFNNLNYTSMLEDSCFYSGVPAEVITISILNCAIPRLMLPYN